MASIIDSSVGWWRAWRVAPRLIEFWRWWTAELAGLLPARLRRLLRPMGPHLALRRDAQDLVLWGASETGWAELARGLDSPEAVLPPEIGAAFSERSRDLAVVLPAGQVLIRRIQVPLALAENLREAIGFELDRYTPWKADQAYYDLRISAQREDSQLLEIDLAVTPRPTVDALLKHYQVMGLVVVAVLTELPEEGKASFDFLPSASHGPQGSALPWMSWIAPGVALALMMVALILPIWQKRAEVHRLGPLVEEARGRAEAAEAIHRQVIALQTEHNFLLNKKLAQPMAVEVLDELARILPDDTWAHQMELKTDSKNPQKNPEVQLRGESGNSGKLITVFEESRLFAQASYKSPVTKGQAGGGDIFHVAAEVKPRPVPEPTVQVLTAPSAPPPGAAAPKAAGAAPQRPAAAPPAAPSAAPPAAPPAAPSAALQRPAGPSVVIQGNP